MAFPKTAEARVTRPVVATESDLNEELVNEFIRHLQEGAKRQRVSPARYLMAPEARESLGLVVPSSEQFLVHRSPFEIPATVEAPVRFVEVEVAGYTARGKDGETEKRERIWSGWEVSASPTSSGTEVGGSFEVGLEPIRVTAPRVSADRRAPTSERGLRTVTAREVASWTGLTEVQFDIQPVLGKTRAITEGVLEAIPVILPTIISQGMWGGGNWDPMLLRFNTAKLAGRMGEQGDMLTTMMEQVNGYSGQAVHFGVQALAEARMAAYLADKLAGRWAGADEWLKERIVLLSASARLALTAYEAMVDQAIAWSQAGVMVLSPREYAFAAAATGSFLDGVSDAGQFIAGDTDRLRGVMAQLQTDLKSLGWKGK